MARKKRKPGKAKKLESLEAKFIGPTLERIARNHFRSAGAARKLVPVIDTLHNKGDLTNEEWENLTYYRDQASLADKSPVRSCCDTSPRGGHGPGISIISAQIETGRIERNLGQLVDIARAVAVDDVSLSEWAISQHGGIERMDESGKVIAIVPRGRNPLEMARMELRMAAHRIVRP